jgi:citrate lyase subunit beta/citryl-CoA lyase
MKAAEDITVRSMLFVPGNHPRRLAKAFDCGADAVIIDLEDAVPASDKAAARIAAAGTVAASRNVAAYVRVNSWAGHDWRADLAEIVRPGLAGVVLPKAETVEELIAVDSGIAALETERSMVAGSVELLPLIESARGVESLSAIAGACPRIRRLSFGVADYSLDLGLLPSADEAELDYIRARLAHVSRAAGLQAPIDSVVVEIRDPGRFRASATRGRNFGMAGKLCIHPDQVPLANEIFSPTAAEVEHARAVISGFESARAAGTAVVTVGGEFVDAPVVERARRVLAMAGVGSDRSRA